MCIIVSAKSEIEAKIHHSYFINYPWPGSDGYWLVLPGHLVYCPTGSARTLPMFTLDHEKLKLTMIMNHDSLEPYEFHTDDDHSSLIVGLGYHHHRFLA